MAVLTLQPKHYHLVQYIKNVYVIHIISLLDSKKLHVVLLHLALFKIMKSIAWCILKSIEAIGFSTTIQFCTSLLLGTSYSWPCIAIWITYKDCIVYIWKKKRGGGNVDNRQ